MQAVRHNKERPVHWTRDARHAGSRGQEVPVRHGLHGAGIDRGVGSNAQEITMARRKHKLSRRYSHAKKKPAYQVYVDTPSKGVVWSGSSLAEGRRVFRENADRYSSSCGVVLERSDQPRTRVLESAGGPIDEEGS